MTSDTPSPGLLRRLGAMAYDALLLLALLMLLSYPYVWLTGAVKPGLLVKTLYQLETTEPERAALREMVATCEG